MKITIDCGSRFRYSSSGPLSKLPNMVQDKSVRDAVFEAVSSAIDELGENADLVELVKVQHFYNSNFAKHVTVLKILILDPVIDGEEPSSRKPVREFDKFLGTIPINELKQNILDTFWEGIEERRMILEEQHQKLPRRPEILSK